MLVNKDGTSFCFHSSSICQEISKTNRLEKRERGPELLESLTARNPCQQIGQPVSREKHPAVGNPARADNISRRKHGSRFDDRPIHIPASGQGKTLWTTGNESQ
jgi:hypothetical protein